MDGTDWFKFTTKKEKTVLCYMTCESTPSIGIKMYILFDVSFSNIWITAMKIVSVIISFFKTFWFSLFSFLLVLSYIIYLCPVFQGVPSNMINFLCVNRNREIVTIFCVRILLVNKPVMLFFSFLSFDTLFTIICAWWFAKPRVLTATPLYIQACSINVNQKIISILIWKLSLLDFFKINGIIASWV